MAPPRKTASSYGNPQNFSSYGTRLPANLTPIPLIYLFFRKPITPVTPYFITALSLIFGGRLYASAPEKSS